MNDILSFFIVILTMKIIKMTMKIDKRICIIYNFKQDREEEVRYEAT